MSPCHYAGNRTRGVALYFFELDSVTSGWVWAERMEKAPEKSSFCPILVLSFHLFHMQPLSDKRFALFFYGSAWPVQNKKKPISILRTRLHFTSKQTSFPTGSKRSRPGDVVAC